MDILSLAIAKKSGGSADAVKYTSQELTEEQQMQARKNLGLYYKEGEETVIEWDGDITDKPEVVLSAAGQTMGASCYKVFDSVPSIETIIGGKYTATFNDSIKTIESEKVGRIDSNCYTISDTLGDIIIVGTAGDHVFAYPEYGIEGVIHIPENGIYLFSNLADYYVSSLVFGSETIHKIESQYLPVDTVKYTKQDLTNEQKTQVWKNVGLPRLEEGHAPADIHWDGDTTGKISAGELFKVADYIEGIDEIDNLVDGNIDVYYGEDDYENITLTRDDISKQGKLTDICNGYVIIAPEAGLVYNSYTLPESGIYFIKAYELDFFVSKLYVVFQDKVLDEMDTRLFPKFVKTYNFTGQDEIVFDEMVAAIKEFERGQAVIIVGAPDEPRFITTAYYQAPNQIILVTNLQPFIRNYYFKNDEHGLMLYDPDLTLNDGVVAGGFITLPQEGDQPNEEAQCGLWRDGIVIASSTPGSKKAFRITVDDSGTITANEEVYD